MRRRGSRGRAPRILVADGGTVPGEGLTDRKREHLQSGPAAWST
jgi:hypothetical protein